MVPVYCGVFVGVRKSGQREALPAESVAWKNQRTRLP
jgi:hypothetical protein